MSFNKLIKNTLILVDAGHLIPLLGGGCIKSVVNNYL